MTAGDGSCYTGRMSHLARALALTLLCGCGTSPEAACEDFVDAVGAAYERCEYGTQEQIEQQAETLYGGCGVVEAIRDVDELYEECLPAIEAIGCDDIEAGRIPPSCENQLLIET
jgi:hypothetical protein